MYIDTNTHIYIYFYSFSKCLRRKRICSDREDFIKCSEQFSHRFLIKGHRMDIINKQWKKVFNIQSYPFKCKEIKPTDLLSIIHNYNPSVVRVIETMIKELKNYSKLTSSNHPFVRTDNLRIKKTQSREIWISTYSSITKQF